MTVGYTGSVGFGVEPVPLSLTRGSVFRRAVGAAVAVAFGAALVGALRGERTVWQQPEALLLAAAGASLVGVVVLAISLSQSSLDGLVALGLPQGLVTPRALAIANGTLWSVIAAACVLAARHAFAVVPVDPLLLALAAGTALGMGTMRLHLVAHEHDAYRSFNLVAMLLGCGSLASMSLTTNMTWYEGGFSALGTQGGIAAMLFNSAALAAGAGVVLLSGSFTAVLRDPGYRARRGGVTALRVMIMAFGASLMGVGAVPVDMAEILHNVFACSAAAAFAALAITLRIVIRRIARTMVVLSYAFLATEVVAYLLFDVAGVFNLTVFELVAFSLVFAWLIALVATSGRAPAAVEEPAGQLPAKASPAAYRVVRVTAPSTCVPPLRRSVRLRPRPPDIARRGVPASTGPRHRPSVSRIGSAS